MTDKELKEIIELAKGEELLLDENETIVTLFKNRVAATPDRICVIFGDRKYTYAQVDEISNKIAVYISRKFGVGRGSFVGVLIHRSELMMIYSLAILKTGAAYMPLNPDYPESRLSFMCEDADLKLILTEGASFCKQIPSFKGYVFGSEELDMLPAVTKEEIDSLDEAKPDDSMILLFTSGSTGKPKAVDLAHRGVVSFCHSYAKILGLSSNDVMAAYANYGFDVHMSDLYPSILVGAPLHILSDAIRKDIVEMNRYLENNHITAVIMTTQLAVMINDINHSLRVLATAGEKLPPMTANPGLKFFNAYGPTEASILVSYYNVVGFTDGKNIGRPFPNTSFYVIDENNKPVPRGQSGELLICGVHLAKGYLNREDITNEKFIQFKLTEDSEPIRGYKSGDLVRWNEQGELDFLGRIDKQTKLRGLRIELGEIEARTIMYPGIEKAIVIVKNDKLCCYYTSSTEIDLDALKLALAKDLAEYMIPNIFIHLDKMPLNFNGKIDKAALPEPDFSFQTEKIPPENEQQEEILRFIADIAKTDSFGITDNILGIGFSSIDIMKLSAWIYEKYSCHVPAAKMMETPTVKSISDLVDKALSSNALSLKHCERETYPASENQKGLYLEWEKNRNTTMYNTPYLKCYENVDAARLAKAVEGTISAHTAVNAGFDIEDGELRQIPRNISFSIQPEKLDFEPTRSFFEEKVKPFNLLKDVLYRIEIFQFKNTTYLFTDFHHIVFDGMSYDVLFEDIEKLYGGGEIAPETISAFDFALYEQEYLVSEEFKETREYFDELVSGLPAAAYPLSDNPDGKTSATASALLDEEEINKYCRKLGVTPGSFLQSAFSVVLNSVTREDRSIYLTISNGRSAGAALQNSIGMFVKTLPAVSAKIEKGLTSENFVKSMHEQLQSSFAREMYPYTQFVQKHRKYPELMFVYQGGVVSDIPTSDKKDISFSPDYAKFPISVMIYPDAGEYHINIEYDGTKYSYADMKTLAESVKNAAENLVVETYVENVSIVSKEDTKNIITASYGGGLSYRKEITWIDAFLDAAKKHPDKTALIDSNGSMSYLQLDEASNKIAKYLLDQGIGKNNFVGIKMGRVKEFIAAQIGINRAGAAFLPIDPAYPQDRIEYMISNSSATEILTEEIVKEILSTYKKPESINLTGPDNYAYMIYTSGSTGKPKGVLQKQNSITAFFSWRNKALGINENSRHGHFASFSFDAAFDDIFSPISAGGEIHVFDENLRSNLGLMVDYINENKLTGLTLPTQLGLATLTQYPDLDLHFIMMGGEKMMPVKKTAVKIINGYGPTEFTVCSSYHIVDQEKDKDIPIGRPVPNSYTFICDKNGNLLPEGMVGEMCLAGPQLAEGYWKREDISLEKFIDCKFLKGQKMYRTGDLGRYNSEGELEFLGRIDTQVKLRGFRIELGEIEGRAAQYQGINLVAAEVRKEQIVLYYTAEEEIDEKALKSFMAETLTQYMVPSVYIRMEEMPLTPNGKIDRKALPEPVLSSSAEYIEPEGKVEIAVAAAMKMVLGIEEKLGSLDDFYELGGDSIKAIRMVSILREEGINVQVSDIMKEKTVRGIAHLAENKEEAAASQEPITGEVEDSAIVCFFKGLDLPKKEHFNQSSIYQLRERADLSKLQSAFDALCLQHDMLRAIYREDRLFIRDVDAKITIEEASVDSIKELEKLCESLQSSIKMEKSLVRAALIHEKEHDYFFIVCHHLVIDGVSWRIIESDLRKAYEDIEAGREIKLPLKTHTYKDYAKALYEYRNSISMDEILYWQEAYKALNETGAVEENDHNRHFDSLSVELSKEDTKKVLKADFAKNNLDINKLFITAVAESYFKMTKKDSLSLQLEGHGREDIGAKLSLDRTVGWFTSIYPVVLKGITGDKENDLRLTKSELGRVPNKGAGFNVLRYIEGERSVGIKPGKAAQIGFNYLGEMDIESGSDEFFKAVKLNTGREIAKENIFGPGISINSVVTGAKLYVDIEYSADEYKEEDMTAFAASLAESLVELAEYIGKERNLKVASDYGETVWREEDFLRKQNEFEQRGESIERIYPLLPMQEGMLLKHMSEPNSWAYRLVNIFEIDAVLGKEQLERVLEKLGRKYEVLRSAIIYENVGIARQAIVDRKLGLEMLDISSEKDPKQSAEKIREQKLTEGFDLEKKPLFGVVCAKSSENSSYLIVYTHHIIVDGWCIGLYISDLEKYLKAEITGQEIAEEVIESPRYEDAVREILGKDKRQALKYWNELLSDYEVIAKIPSYGEVREEERSKDDELRVSIDEETTDRLIALCKEEKATINNAAELLWGLVLQTYSRSEDVVFAKVVSGRDNLKRDVSRTLGLFINSVPVRVKTDKDSTARKMLRKLQEQTAQSNEYDYCPLSLIQQQSELGSQLVGSVLAFENYDSGNADDGSGFLKHVFTKEHSVDEISPILFLDNGNLVLNIKFNTAHYYEDEITGVLTLFEKLAREVASKPNQALSSLDLVDEKELKELTVLGQGENLDYDSSESIVTIFRNRVAQTPDSVGVVYKDIKYTYKEIDDISSRLSVHMAKNFGVGSGYIVSILIERSELMLIYPLAVLKLGAAYMPLDPKFPEDRLLFMCKDAGVKLVLTQGDMIKQHMPGFDGDAIYYESISEMDEVTSDDMKYLVNPSPDDRMIILFTSGSTGKPKAVELNHKGIVNIVHQYTSKYGLSTDDRVAAYANFGFDAHMTDLYPSIFAGAPIYILAEEIRMDLNLLNDYLEENKLTTAFFTTQIAYLMKDINHSLRLIQAGGEKLPPMSKPRCRFINAYGPTECSLYTTACDVDDDFDGRSIGRPIANSKVYIADQNGRIVPRGIPGELLIGGVGVGRGYLNRPELTAEKFVEYIDGEKVYKTGDLVRWAKEGDIEFLGRLDSQVKLRGQRIEIGEIETRVNEFEAVSKAVVTVKSDKLCCYYTAKYDFDEQNLKNYLQEVLTNFMIPEIFIKLSEMPLTQNGKINIRELPEAKFESAEIVLPDSDEEKVLFEIARTIIGHDGFGVTDQLQRVGMSSIAMMRFAVEADKHNIKLKVNDVMKYGSIRNILKNMNSVQYWYNKYDGKKPVAVVVQGVSTFVQVRSLIDILADKGYAVFIIDPIMNHLDKCKGKDKQALADGYVDIVRANIGHGNVDVFAGHSFGGELAYRCACRWNELTDSLAKVILLDSYIVDTDMITEYIEPDEKTKEQMEYSKMADTLKACPIPDFGGEVILFRAMELNPALRNSINEERFKQISDDNLKAWMERVERLKAYDILADHFSITDEKFKSQLSQKINSIMGRKNDVLWLKL